MTADRAALVEKVARRIMTRMQMKEFGYRNEEGNFVCTPKQIDLLTACCEDAASAAIDLIRAETLEDAARECLTQQPLGDDEFTKGYRLACEENARNIRALKGGA